MPTLPHFNTQRRLSDARVFITRAVHYIRLGKLIPRNVREAPSFWLHTCMQVYVYINARLYRDNISLEMV